MPEPRSREIDIDLLRRLIAYDPMAGVLTWLPRTPDLFKNDEQAGEHSCKIWNAKYAGKPALASTNGAGYLHGAVFGVTMLAHVVAWAIHFGTWPVHGIDHEDGRRSNNRLRNMRDVPDAVNAKNQKRGARNTSGVTGVSLHRRTGKWVAMIKGDGKVRNLGYYPTIEKAAAARKAAEKRYGFHPNHGRVA